MKLTSDDSVLAGEASDMRRELEKGGIGLGRPDVVQGHPNKSSRLLRRRSREKSGSAHSFDHPAWDAGDPGGNGVARGHASC